MTLLALILILFVLPENHAMAWPGRRSTPSRRPLPPVPKEQPWTVKVLKQKVLVEFDLIDNAELTKYMKARKTSRGSEMKNVDRAHSARTGKNQENIVRGLSTVLGGIKRLTMPPGTGLLKFYHFGEEVLKDYLVAKLSQKCGSKCNTDARTLYKPLSYDITPEDWGKELIEFETNKSTTPGQRADDPFVDTANPANSDDPLYYAFLRCKKKVTFEVMKYKACIENKFVNNTDLRANQTGCMQKLNANYKKYREEFFFRYGAFKDEYKNPDVQATRDVLQKMQISEQGAKRLQVQYKNLKNELQTVIGDEINAFETCFQAIEDSVTTGTTDTGAALTTCINKYKDGLKQKLIGTAPGSGTGGPGASLIGTFIESTAADLEAYSNNKLKFAKAEIAEEAGLSPAEKIKRDAVKRRMLYKTHKGSKKAHLRENREFIKIMAGDVFAMATSGAKAGGSGSPADIIKSVTAVAKTGLHIAQFVRKKVGAKRDLKKALIDAKIAIASLDMLSPEDPEEKERFDELFENAKLALTMWNKWSKQFILPLEKQTKDLKQVMNGIIASQAMIDEKSNDTTLTTQERDALQMAHVRLQEYKDRLDLLYRENSAVLREVKDFEVTFIELDLKMKKYKRMFHVDQTEEETREELQLAYRSTGRRISDFFKRGTASIKARFTREGVAQTKRDLLNLMDRALEGGPEWVDKVNSGLDLLESVKDQDESWRNIAGDSDSWDNSREKVFFDKIFGD